MKKQPTPKPPAKTAVSIVRPLATVTIEIQGTTHKLTEAEAKDLHAKLASALGIAPDMNRYARERLNPPFQFPTPPPHWLKPEPARPYWEADKIMC